MNTPQKPKNFFQKLLKKLLRNVFKIKITKIRATDNLPIETVAVIEAPVPMIEASPYRELLLLQTALQNFSSAGELDIVINEMKKFFSAGKRAEVFPVFHPKITHPIYLRRGTSDFMNFIQIFVRAEYAQSFYFPPQTIIDLGSYIGLSAIYFANRFPTAKIICVEPSTDNYGMLKLNTRAYPNVTTINTGVWSHKTKLKITNQIGGDWGNIIQEVGDDESGDDTLSAISIADILNDYQIDKIDFLKIDIEGSEKQVFTHHTEAWIDAVEAISCETHDRFLPGCTQAYEALFADRGFDKFQNGEYITFVKAGQHCLDNSLFDNTQLLEFIQVLNLQDDHFDMLVIDSLPAGTHAKHTMYTGDIGGLALTKIGMPNISAILLATADGLFEGSMGIASPILGKRFSENPSSAKARFLFSDVSLRKHQTLDILVRFAGGKTVPIFRLKV
jgi:FkbM family methyltransferase